MKPIPQIRCLPLLFISLILFWASTPILLAQDPLIEEAKKYDDFSKPGFDRDKAVKLYKQYAEKDTTDDYHKILAYHRIAQLYSYACRREEKDYETAKDYYNLLLKVAGKRISIECIFAKSNLASLDLGDQRIKEYMKFINWANEKLIDPIQLKDIILFPPDSNSEVKKKYYFRVVNRIIDIRDSVRTNLVSILGKEQNKKYREIYEEFFGTCSLEKIKNRKKEVIILYVNHKTKGIFEPAEIDNKTELEEIKKTEDHQKESHIKLTEKEREIRDKIRKWANTPEGKELIKFIDNEFPKLKKTEDGRRKALEILEKKRKIWEDSPYAHELEKIIKQLKNMNNLKKEESKGGI